MPPNARQRDRLAGRSLTYRHARKFLTNGASPIPDVAGSAHRPDDAVVGHQALELIAGVLVGAMQKSVKLAPTTGHRIGDKLHRHARNWLIAYNVAKPLKVLRFGTPYEAVEEFRQSRPELIITKLNHHAPGLTT